MAPAYRRMTDGEGKFVVIETEKSQRNNSPLWVVLAVTVVACVTVFIALGCLRAATTLRRSAAERDLHTFHIAGYDPDIAYTPDLANSSSRAFEVAAIREYTRIANSYRGTKYRLRFVTVKSFKRPPPQLGGGVLFYARITISANSSAGKDELTSIPRRKRSLNQWSIDYLTDSESNIPQHFIGDSEATKERSIEVNGQCPPGFTGDSCETVLCILHGGVDPGPVTQLYKTQLDMRHHEQCSAATAFPVDTHTREIWIHVVAMDGSDPQLTVVDPNGNVVAPSGVESSERSAVVTLHVRNPMLGRYMATYHSASGGCQFIIHAYSYMAVMAGFVDSVHGDEPDENPTAMAHSYLVAHANGMPKPGSIQSMELYENGNMIYSQNAMTRYNCAFERYFGPLSCRSPQMKYWYKIFGIDDRGYNFQRVGMFQCQAPPANPCMNGGTPMQNGTMTVCHCPNFVTGMHCENFQCVNGGTFDNSTNTCLCPDGFGGMHCEMVSCSNKTLTNDDAGMDMFFAIGYSGWSMEHINQLHDALNQTVMGYASAHPGYVRHYYAAVFCGPDCTFNLTVDNSSISGNETTYDSFKTDDPQFLVKGVMKQVMRLHSQNVQSQACTQMVTYSIDLLLKYVDATVRHSLKRSPMFLFTDLPSSEPEKITSILQLQANAFANIEFHVMLSPPGGQIAHCNANPSDPGYIAYKNLAHATAGQVIHMQKANYASMLPTYAMSLYMHDTMMAADYMQCTIGAMPHYFWIDSQTTGFSLAVLAGSFAARLTDPHGNSVVLRPIISADNFYLFQMNGEPIIGRYTIHMNAEEHFPCSIRLRATTTARLSFGFTSDMNTDEVSTMPLYMQPLHMVAYVSNDNMTAMGSSVMIYTDMHGAAMTSSGVTRDCSYSMYFGSWACPFPYTPFYAMVITTDNMGYQMQRTAAGFCSDCEFFKWPVIVFAPTAKPGGILCLNGGTFVSNNDTFGCVCPKHFLGDQCELIECINGGQVLPGDAICMCMGPFTGRHCETSVCTDTNRVYPTALHHYPTDQSIAFVVQTTITTALDVQQIKENIRAMVMKMMAQEQNWITHFLLVVFDDVGHQVLAHTTDALEFISGAMKMQMKPGVPGCQMMTLEALSTALENSYDNGLVFVFTDSIPGDYSDQLALHIFNTLADTQIQVNFHQTTIASNPCAVPVGDPALRISGFIAEFSNGVYLQTPKDLVANVLMNYIPSLYQSALSDEDVMADCHSQTFVKFLSIDSHATAFTVCALGYKPSVTIYGPDGTMHTPIHLLNDPFSTQILQIKIANIGDHLMAGVWRVETTTQAMRDGTDSGCLVQSRVQSDLQVIVGYTRAGVGMNADLPNEASIDYSQSTMMYTDGGRLSNLMVAHATNMGETGMLDSVMGYGYVNNNLTMVGAGNFMRRDSCGYEYYSESLTCPSTYFDIAFLISGTDEHGFQFSRVKTTFCKPMMCRNGAVMMNMTSGYFCRCSEYWTGTQCDVPLCANGGRSTGRQCICPDGFSGTHCEMTMCTEKIPNSFNLHEGSYVLLVDTTHGMNDVIESMKSRMKGYIQMLIDADHMVGPAGSYANYILATFSNDAIMVRLVTTTAQEFSDAFVLVKASERADMYANCGTPSLTALNQVFQHPSFLHKNSYVQIITASPPNDIQQMNNVERGFALSKPRVDYVMSGQCVDNYTDINTSPFALAFFKVAVLGGGQVFTLDPTTDIMGFLHNFTLTTFNSYLIMYTAGPCQPNASIQFSHIGYFTISVVGAAPRDITIMDPDGNVYPHALVITETDFFTVLQVYDATKKGTWMVTAASPSACAIFARGMAVFQFPHFGFTNDIHSDRVGHIPPDQMGETNHIVAHSHVSADPPPAMPMATLEYVKIYHGDLVHAYPLHKRGGCSWDYYTEEPFQCPGDVFGVVLTGTDMNGHPVQRISSGICPARMDMALDMQTYVVLVLDVSSTTPMMPKFKSLMMLANMFFKPANMYAGSDAGLMTYSNTTHMVEPMFCSEPSCWQAAITQVLVPSDGNMHNLAHSLDRVLSMIQAAPPAPAFWQVLVVSDGYSMPSGGEPDHTMRTANILKHMGVQIATIPVTDSMPIRHSLMQLASSMKSTLAFDSYSDLHGAALWGFINNYLEFPKPSAPPQTPTTTSTMRTVTTPPTTATMTHTMPMTSQGTPDCPNGQNFPDITFDLIFALDSSSGMGIDNFVQMKTMLKNLIGMGFDVSGNKLRVGFLTMSDQSTVIFPLNGPYHTVAQLQSAIMSAPFDFNIQTLNFSSSLGSVRDYFIKASNGYRPFISTHLLVFIVGDKDNSGMSPAQQAAVAEDLRDMGLGILALSVGDKPDMAVLFQIAGGEHCTMRVGNESDAAINFLTTKLCAGSDGFCATNVQMQNTTTMTTTTTMPMTTTTLPPGSCGNGNNLADAQIDIMLMLDNSATITEYGFAQLREQIMVWVQSGYTISTMKVQLSLTIVSREAVTVFLLSSFHDIQRLLFAIKLASYSGDNAFNVNEALLQARDLLVHPENGYRPDIHNHMLVLAAASPITGADPLPLAAELRQSGLSIFAVAMGNQAEPEKLGHLAGGMDCVVQIPGTFYLPRAMRFLTDKTCQDPVPKCNTKAT